MTSKSLIQWDSFGQSFMHTGRDWWRFAKNPKPGDSVRLDNEGASIVTVQAVKQKGGDTVYEVDGIDASYRGSPMTLFAPRKQK